MQKAKQPGRTAGPLVQNRRRRGRRTLPELLAHPDLFDGGEGADAAKAQAAREEMKRLGELWTQAFADWSEAMQKKGTLRSAGSVTAYEELWDALAEWAVMRQAPAIALDALTVEDLALYVDSREGRGDEHARVSPRHAWRLLTFIDRVMVHRATSRGLEANRCALELLNSKENWRWAHTADNEPALERLSGAHARQLVDFLTSSLPRSGRRGALRSWKELRDAAAVALHLGAGLTPLEVRQLQLNDLTIESGTGQVSRVAVKGHGQTPRREVPIARWAARVLGQWKKVRLEQDIPGEWMFPSTGKGTQWGKGAQNLAVAQVLNLANLPDEAQAGGCFRLRHTFALRQLERGTPLEELGLLLGLKDEDALERYRNVRVSRTEVH